MAEESPSDEDLFAAVTESNPDAEPEEAAAIVAVLRAQLDAEAAAREAASAEGEEADSWQGRRWAFTGRIKSLQHRSDRVPENAPEDPWTASGRTDLF